MTITTPTKVVIVLADSKDALSAYHYMRFNQACARESGLGTDIYDADSHLAKLNLFMSKEELPSLRREYNNLLLGLEALMSNEHLQVAILAPLVLSIDAHRYTDASAEGLKAVHEALLASGITQRQVEEAVSDSKKNFSPN